MSKEVDREELANGYLFSAFKCEEDYPETPYFSQIFYDHTEMKVFSSNHSYKEREKYPKYVSMYWKVETNKAALLDREVVDWDEALKYSMGECDIVEFIESLKMHYKLIKK
jgi:hypothetical protein